MAGDFPKSLPASGLGGAGSGDSEFWREYDATTVEPQPPYDSVRAVNATFTGTVTFTTSVSGTGFMQVGAAETYRFAGRSRIASSADGLISLTNAAGTGFTRLNLGGATASFPSVKRNGTAINFRLGDDSGDASITADDATLTGTLMAGAAEFVGFTGRAKVASSADSILVLTDAAGTSFNRICLGGTSNSFPALQRSAGTLVARLADDSANAGLTCSILTASVAARAADGSAATCSISFTNSTNTGFFTGSDRLHQVANGQHILTLRTGHGGTLRSDSPWGWAATTDPSGGTRDTGLGRSAAGVTEFNNGTVGTLRDATLRNVIGQTGYHEMVEMTPPAAGAANTVRVFAQDNGGGKTQLMAQFPTGGAVQIAIEA